MLQLLHHLNVKETLEINFMLNWSSNYAIASGVRGTATFKISDTETYAQVATLSNNDKKR